MKRVVFPGGSYAECWPSGAFIVTVGKQVLTNHMASPAFEENILFTRGDGAGRFAGQGHQTGRVILWDGDEFKPHGTTCGTNPLIFLPTGGLKNNAGCQDGSQGYRYVATDGSVITGDATYDGSQTVGLAEYTSRGPVTVGQSYVDGLGILYRGTRRILERGHCTFARFNAVGPSLAIAFWKQKENAAVLIWMDESEIEGLELEGRPPIVVPPQEKPKVAPNLQDFYTYAEKRWSELVKDETPHEDQVEAFFRIVWEWHQKDANIGLLKQAPGRSHYKGFSEDYLTYRKDGTVYSGDVVGGIGGPDARIMRTELTEEARQDAWAPPPRPQDAPGDDNPPPPPPPPDDLENSRLVRLERDLGALQEETRKLREYAETLDGVCERLAAQISTLESKPAPRFRIKGNTSRSFAHSHEVNLDVEETR